jgi:two-component system CheB/CheR fusion protein
VSEKERRRIGQDLHDDLGQQLTGISFLSQALRQQVEEKGCVKPSDISNIENLVTKAIRHTRALAHGLASVELGGEDLIAALQGLVREMNELRNVTCRFVCKSTALKVDPIVGGHIYNIVQEAVSNALKHGQARQVVLCLAHRKDNLIITVENDGLPFPKPFPDKQGMGLRTMNYRARLIGARLEIKPRPTEGTVVRCTLPIPQVPILPNDP